MRQNTLAPWAELVPDVGPMTADELLALPEDAWKYELVDGRLVRMSPTGQEHSDIWRRLYRALDSYALAYTLGIINPPDAGYRISRPNARDTVLSPDISFVSTASQAALPPEGTKARQKYAPIAPDLAVEIASPDQYHPEMADKAGRYLEAGTRLVWVVWPSARQIDVWRPGSDAPIATLTDGDMLDGEGVILGFTLPVRELFE